MSDKQQRKHFAAAVGTAFAASIALGGTAAAASDPFQVSELHGGYLQLADSHAGDKDAEGKCGEAKCGADKAKKKEEMKAEGKDGEGNCGGDKAADKDAEGNCGENK